MRRPGPAAAVALLVPLLLAGCRHAPWGGRALRACPGPVVSTRAIAGDFLLRQQVQVDADAGRFAFQLLVQKRGDELLLVGLHALGAKLFTVRQVGTRVTVNALPPRVLAVPPENVLHDLDRIRFAAPAESAEIVRAPDGARVEIRDTRCGYRAVYTTLEEQALP